MTLCVASQQVFTVVYFVINSVQKLLDTLSYVVSTFSNSLICLDEEKQSHSIKSSRAISHVRCLYQTDILRAISVLISRDLMALKTSIAYRHLMRPIAQEDFIKFSRHKSFVPYKIIHMLAKYSSINTERKATL
jgi:hypothetical protein